MWKRALCIAAIAASALSATACSTLVTTDPVLATVAGVPYENRFDLLSKATSSLCEDFLTDPLPSTTTAVGHGRAAGFRPVPAAQAGTLFPDISPDWDDLDIRYAAFVHRSDRLSITIYTIMQPVTECQVHVRGFDDDLGAWFTGNGWQLTSSRDVIDDGSISEYRYGSGESSRRLVMQKRLKWLGQPFILKITPGDAQAQGANQSDGR